VIVRSNIIVSAIHDWFRRIGMRPRDWPVSFPHSPATAQLTLSSVELCLSLSDAFVLYGMRLSLNHFDVSFAHESFCVLFKIFVLLYLRFCYTFSFGVPYGRYAARSVCRTVGMPHDRCAVRSVCHTVGMRYGRCAERSVCRTIGMPYGLATKWPFYSDNSD
jgi:hypothetical protein